MEISAELGCQLDEVPVANRQGDVNRPAESVLFYEELRNCRLLICILPSGARKDPVYGELEMDGSEIFQCPYIFEIKNILKARLWWT